MKIKKILLLLLSLTLVGAAAQAQNCAIRLASINENFSTTPNYAVPTCWTRHSPTVPGTLLNGVSIAHQKYYLYWMDTNGTPNQLAPQSFFLVMQRCTMLGPLSFKLARLNGVVWQWPLEVGTMSDPNNPSTFVPIQAYYPTSSTEVTYTMDLSSYAGTNEYIAFRSFVSEGITFTIDDITFSGPPAINATTIMPVKN
jgi:hypothetical protein